MKKVILPFVCLMASISPRFLLAQTRAGSTNAINEDQPRDDANPTRNEAVWIPSGGIVMNGVMLVAAGSEPHPTVLNLHGLPGNEQNLDLAEVLRRAGYNVLSFHYRGSWGSPGKFTLAGGVDDGSAALAFLEDPAVVAKFHIDTKRLIVIGHSYGGFVAARVAAKQPHVSAIALLAPWNPAKAIPILTVPAEKFAMTAHSVFDDVDDRLGASASDRRCQFSVNCARRSRSQLSVKTSEEDQGIVLVSFGLFYRRWMTDETRWDEKAGLRRDAVR